jgi:protein involved in polysaccharide export with SLBB domain
MTLKNLTLPLVLFFMLFFSVSIQAQTASDLSSVDFSSINVDLLSDAQIQTISSKFESSGMSWDEVEATLLEKGMSASQIQKLKLRLGTSTTSKSSSASSSSTKSRKRTYSKTSDESTTDSDNSSLLNAFGIQEDEKVPTSNIFGMNLFSQKKLTFSPNLNMPTPKDYLIGAGDKLIIDVWGASQQTYEPEVTPEGSVVISNVGVIYISGMTIEEATAKLKKELSKIYAGLRSGNTYLKVSLGSTVRSIKINITGEAYLPGTYTLPAFASVMNALYAAGGPSENGTLRNITVIRNNKTIATLDFYNFLLKGEQPGNIRLEDQDVIFINPYSSRVKISGQVKRNLLFDMKPNETLKDLVSFAGGYTEKAYTQRVKIYRKTLKENSILDIQNKEIDTFKMTNGDEVIIDSLLRRFENRVQIQGAVYRPGYFAINEATTLKTLLEKADGLTGDALMTRASILRTNDDYTTELIAFDLGALLKGTTDITLKREDIVRIYSILDLREEYTFQIEGEVIKPGKYPYSANANLEDLIAMAGGFKESASQARIEVARRITKSEDYTEKTAEIYQFSVSADLRLTDSTSKFKLQPYDKVYVHRSPGYETQQSVYIVGEVKYPGVYSLSSKTETISDLVARAGGINNEAYIKGGTLIRRKTDQMNKRDFILKDLISPDSIDKDSIFQDEVIGIRLEKIIDRPQSKYNLTLLEGDILQIPKKLQTVRVSGNVLHPISVRYDAGRRVRGYVSMAGGFGERSRKSKVYVIYPNGTIKRTHNVLLCKFYPHLEPGAEIVVPQKAAKTFTAERFLGMGSTLASIASVVVTLIILTR